MSRQLSWVLWHSRGERHSFCDCAALSYSLLSCHWVISFIYKRVEGVWGSAALFCPVCKIVNETFTGCDLVQMNYQSYLKLCRTRHGRRWICCWGPEVWLEFIRTCNFQSLTQFELGCFHPVQLDRRIIRITRGLNQSAWTPLLQKQSRICINW